MIGAWILVFVGVHEIVAGILGWNGIQIPGGGAMKASPGERFLGGVAAFLVLLVADSAIQMLALYLPVAIGLWIRAAFRQRRLKRLDIADNESGEDLRS